jgi:hypothetical protein
MFGRDWQKVSGTVVSRRITGAVAGQYGNEFRHEYVVDLQAPDQQGAGSARRVTVQDPKIKTYYWNAPKEGEVIALKIRADGRVVFNKRDPRRNVRKFKRLSKKGLA